MRWKPWCHAMLAAVFAASLAPSAQALTGVSGWAQAEVDQAEAVGLVPEIHLKDWLRGKMFRARNSVVWRCVCLSSLPAAWLN